MTHTGHWSALGPLYDGPVTASNRRVDLHYQNESYQPQSTLGAIVRSLGSVVEQLVGDAVVQGLKGGINNIG